MSGQIHTRRRVLAAGMGALLSGLVTAVSLSAATPQPVPAPRPPVRRPHAAVFEPVRGLSVVLGGQVHNVNVTDVWTLDRSDRWANVTPIPNIGPRYGHAAAVDPVSGLIYLFGGEMGHGPMSELWQLRLP